MRILRSPVFYFGILLFATVVAALAAPFIVDWGRYRGDLENWGRDLTGREVAIRGPIAVTLFPFPQLTAEDVAIANPDGFAEPVFVNIEKVKVSITLGGLINGELRVEAIELQRPLFSLERNEGESANWQFTPSGAARSSTLLEHIRLDQIHISQGSVFFTDHGRKTSANLTDIDTTLSAAALSGPWRVAGTARTGSLPISFSGSTGLWQEGHPLRLSLRVAPSDQTGYSLSIDGATSDEALIAGEVNLNPVQTAEGKGDTEGSLRAMAAKAAFTVGFDRLVLKDIEIRPAAGEGQGALVSGTGSVEFGPRLAARIDLSSPRIDLDALAGAGSRRLIRVGGTFGLFSGILEELPENVDIEAGIKIASLKAASENLENMELAFLAQRQNVQIKRLSAALPGRSSFLMQGNFSPGQRFSEFDGKVSLESFDARTLVAWVWPEAKPAIEMRWTGSRGHFKGEGQLRLSAASLTLTDIAFELDGKAGSGSFIHQMLGERQQISLGLSMSELNLDAFMPPWNKSPPDWPSLALVLFGARDHQEVSINGDIASLLYNGVEAEGVKLDLETTERGYNLKSFGISSVGGAKIDGSGVMLLGDAGADGDIGLRLTADSPRDVLRLLGLLPAGRSDDWSEVLGKTDLSFDVMARAEDVPGTAHIRLAGTSGPISFKAQGSGALRSGFSLSGEGHVESTDSASLWRLLGLGKPARPGPAASLDLSFNSTQAYPRNRILLSLYGAHISFEGDIDAAARSARGSASLKSPDVRDFADAMDLPLKGKEPFAADLSSQLDVQGERFSATAIAGDWAGTSLAGELRMAEGRKLSGSVEFSSLSAVAAAAALFLPWNGEPPSLEVPFAKTAPFGLSGTLQLTSKNLQLLPEFSLGAGAIDMAAAGTTRAIRVRQNGELPDNVIWDMQLDTSAVLPHLEGTVSLPLDLRDMTRLDNGDRAFQGQARGTLRYMGEGLTPAAIVSGLNGTGHMSLKGGRILNLSPQAFRAAIPAVHDAAALDAAFKDLQKGDGLALPPVTISLALDKGEIHAAPIEISGDDVVTVTPSFDLNEASLRVMTYISFKNMASFPPLTLVYNGSPLALRRRLETSGLAAQLGFSLLRQGVDELEKVQAEQEKLAREEEEARKQDARRFEIYMAQRAELRLRMRQLRLFEKQREQDALMLSKLTSAELERKLRALNIFGRGPETQVVRPRLKP